MNNMQNVLQFSQRSGINLLQIQTFASYEIIPVYGKLCNSHVNCILHNEHEYILYNASKELIHFLVILTGILSF